MLYGLHLNQEFIFYFIWQKKTKSIMHLILKQENINFFKVTLFYRMQYLPSNLIRILTLLFYVELHFYYYFYNFQKQEIVASTDFTTLVHTTIFLAR